MDSGNLAMKINNKELVFPLVLDVEIYVDGQIYNETVELDTVNDYQDYLPEVCNNILFRNWHYDFRVNN